MTDNKVVVRARVTETRTGYMTLDPDGFPDDCKTPEKMIEYVKKGFEEIPGYSVIIELLEEII